MRRCTSPIEQVKLRVSRGQLHAPKATRRRSDAATLHILIFDRTSIAKYAFDRIISVCVPNLLSDSQMYDYKYLTYQLNESRRHSFRSWFVSRPPRSGNKL